MVGLFGSSRAKPIGPALSTYACLPRSSIPFRLAPAENASSPAPVRTSTRAPASAAKASIASPRATASSASTLLWTSGRLSVNRVTGPRCSTSNFGIDHPSFDDVQTLIVQDREAGLHDNREAEAHMLGHENQIRAPG